MVRKRKIIVYIATSADGFIARPDGSVDWLDRPPPKGNYGMGAFYKSIDTVLWGRKTCEIALDFQKKGVTGSAFDTFDTRVKNYVFTRSPLQSPAPAGVEFVSEPIKAFATRLREKKGKDIWMMGGADIIASFQRSQSAISQTKSSAGSRRRIRRCKCRKPVTSTTGC
jgi:dihydrofolate reductase